MLKCVFRFLVNFWKSNLGQKWGKKSKFYQIDPESWNLGYTLFSTCQIDWKRFQPVLSSSGASSRFLKLEIPTKFHQIGVVKLKFILKTNFNTLRSTAGEFQVVFKPPATFWKFLKPPADFWNFKFSQNFIKLRWRVEIHSAN